MTKTALVAGVGSGLGESLVRKLAQEGCRVAMFARSAEYLAGLENSLKAQGHEALAVPTDLTDKEKVADGFKKVRENLGPIDILIYHAGAAQWSGLIDTTAEQFEQAWKVIAYGGFLCAQEAVGDMLAQGGGAILFTGATSGLRGSARALAFSSAKFALRGLADSLARELWPKNIHVAHIVIDGWIDSKAVRERLAPSADEPVLNPNSIAQNYWNLIMQEKSAWTFEIEQRPHKEEFFT